MADAHLLFFLSLHSHIHTDTHVHAREIYNQIKRILCKLFRRTNEQSHNSQHQK